MQRLLTVLVWFRRSIAKPMARVRPRGAVGPGGPIATAGGLVFIGATIDKRFHAFDSRIGKVLWETTLDSGGHSTPMTYMSRNGKQ